MFRQTDDSRRSLGVAPLQGPQDNQPPVAYISHELFPTDVHYSMPENEALAIKWALYSFKYYLLGRDFTQETDHSALYWVERVKDTTGRITGT